MIDVDIFDKSEEGMYLKKYKSGKELLVAVCDCDILGKRFEEGALHIDVCEEFFGREKTEPDEIKRALRSATIANFVGIHSVDFAISLGYVDRENVLMIDGVPCAQMVLM
jgi:hypothetical protein